MKGRKTVTPKEEHLEIIDPAWALETVQRYEQLAKMLKSQVGRNTFKFARGTTTMQRFAKKVGFSLAYISFIESGREPASVRYLKAVLKKCFSEGEADA